MMKINKRAATLLAGIRSTCMLEMGEVLSEKQKNFLKSIFSDIPFKDFCGVFPLEKNPKEGLQKDVPLSNNPIITAENVLRFFGGDKHIEYASEDVAENGLEGVLADIFLIFHVVIPVKIKEIDGVVWGSYQNNGLELRLKGLEFVNSLSVDPDKHFLVHYGLIFDCAQSKEEVDALLSEQLRSKLFRKTCQKVHFLDCGKLLNLLQSKRNIMCHR